MKQLLPHVACFRRLSMNNPAMRLMIYLAIAVISATTSVRAEGSYVVCENGLRCVAEPCPSKNALDVGSHKLIKGVWTDTASLNAAEQAKIDAASGLYHGSLVVRGQIGHRNRRFFGKLRSLVYLVISGIERRSIPRERQMCGGHL